MIMLRGIRLINWYGFGSETIPIGRFSLIAGKNGNGKSVLLDAIKYALYGDTVFNKSTENKGSRTLSSYTRGLLDATAGTYMRPAESFPNITTHIVLEMHDEEMDRSFVLGTVIETDSADVIKTNRYILENMKLQDLEYSFTENGMEIPYTTLELMKKHAIKMLDANEGILKFMQRTGLRLNEQQMIAFRRKLRSIMSYDPDAKIDQFIRESVLEKKKVDFTKLIEAKTNIDKLNGTFDVIDNEIKELEEILKLYDQLKNSENIILADNIKITYKRLLRAQEEIEEATGLIDTAQRQADADEEKLAAIEKRTKEINKSLRKAEDSLNEMDCAKAIAIARENLQVLEEQKTRLSGEKVELGEFQTRISELMAWLLEQNINVKNQTVLSALETQKYSISEKESAIYGLRHQIYKCRDEFIGAKARLKDKIINNDKEQARQQKVIDDCNSKKTSFSEIPEYIRLKYEINKNFQQRGINAEAKLACEYVLDITDEKWRDAIETFLGNKRYTILVAPEYYDIADAVLNNTRNNYAHLFNTTLLMKKTIKVEEDSAINLISVKNEVANQYFKYQLGRMHAVPLDQIKQFENAISVEGRVSVAMDSYFLNFSKLRFYCLGQKTIELNRIRAEKELEKLREEAGVLREKDQALNQKIGYLDDLQGWFKPYNFDANYLYQKVVVDYKNQKNELKALELAQKNNSEYMELFQLCQKYRKELGAIENEKKEAYHSKAKMQTQIEVNQLKVSEKEKDKIQCDQALNEYKITNYEICIKAIQDYDDHIKNGKESPGGVQKDRPRAERALEQARRNLTGAQSSYNAHRSPENRLPLSETERAAYEQRKTKIWMDDLQEVKSELASQTRRYEEIFKREFVLTVLRSCESAKNDLDLINVELSRLKFKSKYEFDVKYKKDGSDYELILKYANYLKEREDLGTADGQVILGSMTSFTNDESEELEKNIRKIINRVIESNDRELIEKYADYRNYMTYEILLTNDVLNKAKLSKQSGYNSGAEVQIPYMLILLSALLLIYNEKLNSTRLIFIDEPFAKMDPTNVKIMLGFMKEQKLQMVFCAPDKTELIGSECDVILPVLRVSMDLMEIGIVEMREGV